ESRRGRHCHSPVASRMASCASRRRGQRRRSAASSRTGPPVFRRSHRQGGTTLSEYEITLRLFAAAALGSLIGFERERLLWAAGIRTHMLVCVGSCLIMIVSAYGFAGVLGQQNTVLDPSRVAAQVVSGIGFLGAG